MGRPIFTYELADPDFSWLISNFKENNPQFSAIETGSLPVVFISSEKTTVEVTDDSVPAFDVPPITDEAESDDTVTQGK